MLIFAYFRYQFCSARSAMNLNSATLYSFQTLYQNFKSLAKKIRALYLSLTVWWLALNLRRETKVCPIWIRYFYDWLNQINKVILYSKLINYKINKTGFKIFLRQKNLFTNGFNLRVFTGYLPYVYTKKEFTYKYVNNLDFKNEGPFLQYSYGTLWIFKRFLLKVFSGFLKSSNKVFWKIHSRSKDNVLKFKTYIYRRVIINHNLIQSRKIDEPNLTGIRWIRKKSFLVLYSALDMKWIPSYRL